MISKFNPFFIVVILASIAYAWLTTPIPTGLDVGHRFDWPDETANFFFARQYATTGQLQVAEPLNAVADDHIHPRSVNVHNSYLLPGSFLGLPLLYGLLGRVFGSFLTLYFTPLFGILGALAFYGILRRIFSEYTARLSGVLLLLHPAWWYYSVTSLLPNVSFISFLLFSVYCIVRPLPTHTRSEPQPFGRKTSSKALWPLLLGGLCAGIAISIRPSEVVWMGMVLAAALFFARQKLSFSRVAFFLILVGLAIYPTLWQQQQLYGSWATSGYAQLQNEPPACGACAIAGSLLLPFGFHPYLVGVNVWTHLLSRLWIWSLLGVLGFAAFTTQRSRPATSQYAFLGLGIAVSLFLAVYYGSWQFDDQLTVALNTLGVSYVRYWLPVFLFIIPFVAYGLQWLTVFFKRQTAVIVLVLLLLGLGFNSAQLTLWARQDSILPVRERIAGYKQIASEVNALTEPDAVIITVRKDKLFFPDRKVIHSFEALSRRTDLIDSIERLLKLGSVYYYALGPEPSLELTNTLELEERQRFGQEVLYQIKFDEI